MQNERKGKEMDFIDRAIQNGLNISGGIELDSQTWEAFEKKSAGKKVLLFGAGACADFYFMRYKDKVALEGVIDNDCKKHGFYVDDFISEAFYVKDKKIKITGSSLLGNYRTDEIVVLISSTKYYKAISEQLEGLGIFDYFVLLIMEANERRSKEWPDLESADDSLKRKAFAEECCRQYPVEKKKVFFRAYGDYTDHGKYITEALVKARKDLDIVWALDDMTTMVPKGVRKVYKGNWKKFVYEMETAGIWVLDLAVPSYVLKREGQIYLQTKHWASITLKRFYLDASTFEEVPELVENWKRDGKMIDHVITGSDFDEESCRRGFGFRGEVLPCGSPRSDALFHEEENRKKVYEHYKIGKKIKTLLYAPTYRFDKTRGKSFHSAKEMELDFAQTKKALEERFTGEWNILLRLHPSVAQACKNMEKPDFVIDVSDYKDSQELVSAADITISDFSSIMFEPAFVKKPVFLFATDIQEYIANEYDLLIKYEELPFPVAESNEELAQNIRSFDQEAYVEQVGQFLEGYGVCEDGHASERVAEYISKRIGE